ncbi:hypothetical protein DPMN_012867 [Dreissena polymorpha]|uniref:Uncharacterized protein n=1 Tax=Dreissena polymorpha TaxID=45954 RepID=A0A9D4S3S0_DREPO|nr:hypothetical protein DPMN_012867 [Dreissena polymorpha]
MIPPRALLTGFFACGVASLNREFANYNLTTTRHSFFEISMQQVPSATTLSTSD